MAEPFIYIALPVLDELENIPGFIKNLKRQTYSNYYLYVCVNQPDEWWENPEKVAICENNLASLALLQKFQGLRIKIIDRCSPGSGWKGKNHGIGWARKLLMDEIASMAADNDIILSMDADTFYSEDYLDSIAENLALNEKVVALSVPYYHHLTGNESIDRAMLRYEIYMRSYAINMFRISSPYCFTALGSAIALPVWAYKAIGGITPRLSGEDFYFLQKLVKYGEILHWNNQMVYPAARLSSRVYFGTGPALIKGIQGNWESYPVYPLKQFDLIAATYQCFGKLYTSETETPMDSFLVEKFGELPWSKLRSNSTSRSGFIKLCYQKIDGLRILQFLKETRPFYEITDEEALIQLLHQTGMQFNDPDSVFAGLNFENSPISGLDSLRNTLFATEDSYRRAGWMKTTGLNSIYN